MNCTNNTMLLYAVTDRSWTGSQTLYQQVKAALKGGATCMQLREKELNDQEFLTEAKNLSTLCRNYQVPLIINDNVRVAVACNADGVHVGQADMETANVRALIGEDKILGVSAQTVEQAVMAERNGADYLGVGAVFATSTKKDAETLSHKTLTEICSAVSIPVVAIGGISKDNILRLAGSGVSGIALVSAIFASRDIEAQCRELLSLSQKMVAS
ncbi:MAG: thiamine phosphate synthase [Lachnospiraceae bacterium]